MNETYSHIFLNELPVSISYTANKQKGADLLIPNRDRNSHSQKLNNQLKAIWSKIKIKEQARTAISLPTKNGAYLEFSSQAGKELVTKSLEDIRSGVRLLNVKYTDDQAKTVIATVFIPKGKESILLKKIVDYQESETKSGNPKNQNLVNSIEDIKIALVESLWTDSLKYLPKNNKSWCEIWLRTEVNSEEQSEENVVNNFRSILEQNQIQYKQNIISFPERVILLAFVNRKDLEELIELSNNIAEFRAGQETAAFWVEEKNVDQAEWVSELLSRMHLIDSNVKVCILDTGIANGHPLLSPILGNDDCLTVNPLWGTSDHAKGSGHGTPMGGVVAYGSLESVLQQTDPVEITHTLCSVKILPPSNLPQTKTELWGNITEQAISRAEIQSPTHNMVFCMAVTAFDDVDQGRPSSWSGAVDKISFGTEDLKRLIIISAGNVAEQIYWESYPDSNLTYSILNPAQSWNALTVGAYTEKVVINDSTYLGHNPLAPPGCLSPFSSTSIVWEKAWPNKPDVVFEGGNILLSPSGEYYYNYAEYGLLTVSKLFVVKSHFDTINATSAATAQASWMAAKLMYQYPNAWPETIRGLIVHSASWSDQMLNQFNIDISKKAQVKDLLRIFGYGMPSLDKSLFTTKSSLTFISQQHIQPFIKEGSSYKSNEMHFYEIPWPKDELLAMENTSVELQITLSYFIEPGPGQVGWKDKYRYQSFGLRFDLNAPLEPEDEFKKRINAEARDEDEVITSDSGSNRWQIGKKARNLGSISSDRWYGTASEIASCNLLAIFPVIGWWRERHNLKKYDSSARYSVLISLRTPASNIDLYTPVINKINNAIPISIPTL
ncbi:S8 family peptidase [Spirosoma litoris]